MDEQDFVGLLQKVLTPDTSGILAATTTLKEKYYGNPAALPVLVGLLARHPDTALRHLAAVEARSLIPKLWPKQAASDKQEIRAQLLSMTVSEENTLVRHACARLVAAVANVDFKQDQWPDLLSHIATGVQDAKPENREVSLYIIYALLDSLEEQLSDKWPDFFQLFSHTIKDPQSVRVRMNTVLALGKIADATQPEDTETQAAFCKLLPQMVQILREVVNDEEMATEAFNVFQNLLINESGFIGLHFKELIEFMLEMASAKDTVDDDSRCKALNFLISCLQYKKHKVQSAKIAQKLTEKALEIGSEPGSRDEDDDSDDETTQPWKLALRLVDYLAANLPPSQVVNHLLNILPKFSNSSDPNARIAAVMSLGYCAEGAPDFMSSQIHMVFPVVLNLLSDPERAVRFAALQSLGRMSDDMEELATEHASVVPALLKLIHDSSSSRSQEGTLNILKASCNTLSAFLATMGPDQMSGYLGQIMPALNTVFEQAGDDLQLKASVVAAIGSASAASGSDFVPYFDGTMAAFHPFLSLKHGEDELALRATTYDALGGVLEAVEGPAFAKYMPDIMATCQEALQLGDARLNESCFIFFGTSSKVYLEDFGPFIDWVVPAIFKSIDQDEKDEIEGIEAGDVELGAKGTKGIKVKNLQIIGPGDDDDEDEEWEEDIDAWNDVFAVGPIAMEKEIAIDTLGDLLSNSKRSYAPLMEQTITRLVSKASHEYEGIRKAAIGSLWRAYCVVWELSSDQMQKWEPGWPLKHKVTPELETLGNVILTCTLFVLKTEDESDVVKDICVNMAEALKLTGPAILNDPNGTAVKIVLEQLEEILKKKHPSQLELDLNDDDSSLDGNLEEVSELEWELIESAFDLCVGLSYAMGPQFPEIWSSIAPLIVKYMSSQEPRERSAACGAVGEVIKAMGAAVTPFTDPLLALFSKRLGDPDRRTKSNAAYGAGLLCLHSQASDSIKHAYPDILDRLVPVLGDTSHPEEDPHNLVDNTCGAVSRLILAFPDLVDLEEVLPLLVSHLPLRNDYGENEPIWEMVCKLYDAKIPVMEALTPRIVKALSEVLKPVSDGGDTEEQVEKELKGKLVLLVKYLATGAAAEVGRYPNLVAIVQG